MTSQPQRRPWVHRHPVLTILWLLIAGFWVIALVSVYDDDSVVSIVAYLFVMAATTLIVFGLGMLSARIHLRRRDESGALSPVPDHLRSPSSPLEPGAASQQRKLDDETRRQRDLTIQLGQREADLGRREADLRLREALLLSEPQSQPVSRLLSAPESKPSLDPAVMHPDRSPDQSAPARFCFNCGAWFARDDETCRLCGARRVGSES